MSRNRLLSSAALALAALAAATLPARAQVAPVPGAEIEGPIGSVRVFARPQTAIIPDPSGGPGTVTYRIIGELRVMDILIKVREDALIHTPTNPRITLADLRGDPMPGRTQRGFIGGTAIVTGDSYRGVIYASDVFSDLFEHVVVGEATRVADPNPHDDLPGDLTVNNMAMTPSTDPRMPAAPPINGFGFEIRPDDVQVGTLLAVEGYYSSGQRRLYYHTMEADAAPPKNAGITEVSILRAQCRLRDDGVELEVRGGVHDPAEGTVQLFVEPEPGAAFVSVGEATAVADLEVTPPQGEYRFRAREAGFPACPPRAKAVFGSAEAVADFDSR